MDVLIVPKTLASLEYTALRLPLTLVQTQVVNRLPAESGVRLGFEKALGQLDVRVGKLIGDESLTARGAALTRKVAVLTTAVELEDQAAARKEQAARAQNEASATADRERQQAEQRARTTATAVRRDQSAEKRAVQQKADATAAAKTRSIERARTKKINEEKRRLDSKVEAIDSRTSARTAAPSAQLSSAVDLAADAAQQKQTASRLDQLADAERVSRQRS